MHVLIIINQRNILCHSLVIEIDSDVKRSVVFADTQSDEKNAGIFVLENPMNVGKC